MTIRSSNCVYWLLEEVNGRQFPFSCFSTNQPPRASYWLHLSSLGRFSFDLLHVNQWSLCVLHQPLFSLLSRLLTLFSKTINHFDCCFLCLVCIFLGTSDTVLVKSKIFCDGAGCSLVETWRSRWYGGCGVQPVWHTSIFTSRCTLLLPVHLVHLNSLKSWFWLGFLRWGHNPVIWGLLLSLLLLL